MRTYTELATEIMTFVDNMFSHMLKYDEIACEDVFHHDGEANEELCALMDAYILLCNSVNDTFEVNYEMVDDIGISIRIRIKPVDDTFIIDLSALHLDFLDKVFDEESDEE